MAKYDDLKSTLYKFYVKNRNLGRKQIFEKFRELDAPKRSLNRWLTILEEKKIIEKEKSYVKS